MSEPDTCTSRGPDMKRSILACVLLGVLVVAVRSQQGLRSPAFVAQLHPNGPTVTNFNDTFTRADADPMSTTASDGHTWTKGPGALADPRIISNELNGNTGETGCRALTPTFSGNQSSSMVVLANYGAIGPMVRMQGVGDCSGYLLVASTATELSILKVTDTGTIAYSSIFTSGVTPTINGGDIIKLTISGTTLTAYLNGVSYGTVMDATWSGGQPGIWINSNTSSGDSFFAENIP